jgi:hypothetical protein
MSGDSIAARARAAGVPQTTAHRWIRRGDLNPDATVEEMREHAERRRRKRESTPDPEPAQPAPLSDEIRDAVERGELRVWTPTSPDERARYGLPPLEDEADQRAWFDPPAWFEDGAS